MKSYYDLLMEDEQPNYLYNLYFNAYIQFKMDGNIPLYKRNKRNVFEFIVYLYFDIRENELPECENDIVTLCDKLYQKKEYKLIHCFEEYYSFNYNFFNKDYINPFAVAKCEKSYKYNF